MFSYREHDTTDRIIYAWQHVLKAYKIAAFAPWRVIRAYSECFQRQ